MTKASIVFENNCNKVTMDYSNMTARVLAFTFVPEPTFLEKEQEIVTLCQKDPFKIYEILSALQKLSLEKACDFSAKMAAICYLKDTFDNVLSESSETTKRRFNQVLNSGHHSVFDHFKITLELRNVPKIVAMFLNNEGDYTTSEKSARYTKYNEVLSDVESSLYFKWCDKLTDVIANVYPNLVKPDAKDPYFKIKKLAQENARYFVSIFTPGTTLGYTTSLRQFNYLLAMIKEFVEHHENNMFENQCAAVLELFYQTLDFLKVPNLEPNGKYKYLSLLGDKAFEDMKDIFDYVYQTSFDATFACLAQNQRHRTEKCFMYLYDDFSFYVPEILRDNESLVAEWLEDAKKVAGLFPQGQIIKICQTGTIETFLLKYCERCCGSAQLEIMRSQVEIAKKFIKESPYGYIISEYTNEQTARCQFKSGFCGGKCMLGSKQYERKI